MKQDWRITNQMNYLQNAALRYQSFETTPDSDHEHCSFSIKNSAFPSTICIPDIVRLMDATGFAFLALMTFVSSSTFK